MISKSYPAGTPNVTYAYDGTGVINGNALATNYTAFDALGKYHTE